MLAFRSGATNVVHRESRPLRWAVVQGVPNVGATALPDTAHSFRTGPAMRCFHVWSRGAALVLLVAGSAACGNPDARQRPGGSTPSSATPTGTSSPTTGPTTGPPPGPCTVRSFLHRSPSIDHRGHVNLSVIENPGPSFRPPSLTVAFGEYAALDEIHEVLDPLEGLDDCVVYGEFYTVTAEWTGQSAGTLQVTIGEHIVQAEPEVVGDHVEYSPNYGGNIYLWDQHGIAAEDVFGAAISLHTEGGDIEAIALEDLVRFPATPLAITHPDIEEQFFFNEPADLVYRWQPDPDGHGEVLLTIGISDDPDVVSNVHCLLEDDGEWSPPPEVWTHFSPPTTLYATMHRRDYCEVPVTGGWISVLASQRMGISPAFWQE